MKTYVAGAILAVLFVVNADAGDNLRGEVTGKKTISGPGNKVSCGWIDVKDGGHLIITAGAEIRFDYDPRHPYGSGRRAGICVYKGGLLEINGTAAQPVVLTSGDEDILKAKSPAEDWHGIMVKGGHARITGAVFRYTRSPAIAFSDYARGVVTSCTFERGGTPIELAGGARLEKIAGCRFVNSLTDVFAKITDGDPGFESNNMMDSSARVLLFGFEIPGTYTLAPATELGRGATPYDLGDGITVGSDKGQVSLTIQPRTVIEGATRSAGGIRRHSSIVVKDGASLNVRGAPNLPVHFRHRGKPDSGDLWGGIIFDASCGTVKSSITRASFQSGGSPYVDAMQNERHAKGMVTVSGGDVSISQCTFERSGGSGVYVENTRPKIRNCEFIGNKIGLNFKDIPKSIHGEPLKVENCTVSGNSDVGARCNNCCQSNVVVNMKSTWWKEPSGPLDDSDDRPIGSYNPKGRGDRVSDFIWYEPWRKYPPTDSGSGTITDGETFFSSSVPNGSQFDEGATIPLTWTIDVPDAIEHYKASLDGKPISQGMGDAGDPKSISGEDKMKPPKGTHTWLLEIVTVGGEKIVQEITFSVGNATIVDDGTTKDPGDPGTGDPKDPGTGDNIIPPLSSAGLVAGTKTVLAGEVVTIPIRAVNVSGLGSLNFVLRYDARVVAVEQVIKGDLLKRAGAMFKANPKERGIIRFGFAGSKGVHGDGPIAQVVFKAVGKAGDRTDLKLIDILPTNTSGAGVTLDKQDGGITIIEEDSVTSGDANKDGTVDILDALDALSMSVKLIPEDLLADMDKNGRVTAEDARLILVLAIK